MKKKFRLKSFGFAIEGFLNLVRNEPNARIHLAAAILAVVLGLLIGLSATEWLFVCLAIALVFAAELINSALEKLSDAVKPEPHPLVKSAKDYSAAAVLITTLFSVIVACVIFLPEIIRFLISF